MKVIDGFLPDPDALCDALLGNDMPWFFEPNISGQYGGGTGNQYGFFHLFYYEGNYSFMAPAARVLMDRAGEELGVGWDLWRCRAGLSTNMGRPAIAHPHQDYDNPHQVVLWYANDADGDTLLYEGTPDTGLTVVERVMPKRNRAVIFDGLTFHSSSFPVVAQARVAVNMDFFARN